MDSKRSSWNRKVFLPEDVQRIIKYYTIEKDNLNQIKKKLNLRSIKPIRRILVENNIKIKKNGYHRIINCEDCNIEVESFTFRRKLCPDCYRKRRLKEHRIWNKNNPEKEKLYGYRNYEKNKEKRKEYNKNHRHQINLTMRIRLHQRWINEPSYRIASLLQTRLGDALRRYTKTGKIMSSSKYKIDYKAVIEHLMKTLPKDFNQRKYHIDHKICLASFNLINQDGSTNLEEVRKAFEPENHQWLLAEDNLRKGSLFNGVRIRKKNLNFSSKTKIYILL